MINNGVQKYSRTSSADVHFGRWYLNAPTTLPKRATYVKCKSKHDCTQILYGVATISRLLQIIGLFCRISSLLLGSFAKENYNFKEPTNRSHPIATRATSSTQTHHMLHPKDSHTLRKRFAYMTRKSHIRDEPRDCT